MSGDEHETLSEVERAAGGPGRAERLVVVLAGEAWACARDDGGTWTTDDDGRVRLETYPVPVLASPLATAATPPGRATRAVEQWHLTNPREGR